MNFLFYFFFPFIILIFVKKNLYFYFVFIFGHSFFFLMEEHQLNELDRYDRQIRAWGFETQQKLHECNFLFFGVNSASLECMKNLILAGASEVHITDTDENLETYSHHLYFLVALNPYCPTKIIPFSNICDIDQQKIKTEEIDKYNFICIFKNEEFFIKQIASSDKVLLFNHGATGDILYQQPEYDFPLDTIVLTPSQQTVIGALLSQMIVDHLPPIQTPIHYQLTFDPIQLSSSVKNLLLDVN